MVKPEDWREARDSFGETQEQFALRIGVSRPYLNQLENGSKTSPGAAVLKLLRAVLAEPGTGSKKRAAILKRIQSQENSNA